MRNLGLGALVGVVIGGALVGVGLVRALTFLLGGGSLREIDAHQLRMLAFYVGGFGVAGALLGAAQPVLGSRAGVYAGCMVTGVVVMLAIVLGDKGSFAALDATAWIILPAMGAAFGAAAASGWSRGKP